MSTRCGAKKYGKDYGCERPAGHEGPHTGYLAGHRITWSPVPAPHPHSCGATDNYYTCIKYAGHDGDHEAKAGCLIAHRWKRTPTVPGPAPSAERNEP